MAVIPVITVFNFTRTKNETFLCTIQYILLYVLYSTHYNVTKSVIRRSSSNECLLTHCVIDVSEHRTVGHKDRISSTD